MKAVTSEAPTGTKWVDVMTMNDDGEEFMTSRSVARDFRPRHGRPDRLDLFAAMPPLMAKKMPFVMTFAWGAFDKRGTKDEQKMSLSNSNDSGMRFWRCSEMGSLWRGGRRRGSVRALNVSSEPGATSEPSRATRPAENSPPSCTNVRARAALLSDSSVFLRLLLRCFALLAASAICSLSPINSAQRPSLNNWNLLRNFSLLT